MRKFVSALCATALTAAMAVMTVAPTNAAPAYVPNVQQRTAQNSDVVQVQDWRWKKKRNWNNRNWNNRPNWNGQRRAGPPRNWNTRNWNNNSRYGWYNGHRGYRYARPGYRYYDGFWFPAGAFIAGAIISGAIANNYNQPRYSGGGNAHVQWCYDRYRSYRAYDNTYQPYNGPRRQCYSPYD